ncbi:MAG: 5'/3'-nucleotidase SurE [Lachnospiraceae bacterium]|nr:5'/3'-nucleotidase SurE [Lachnospiraceae bacterium]
MKESLNNNSRRILITNDDGIKAEGLVRLASAALKYGEVWVVAPASERSAASHSIALRSPVDVYPVEFPVQGVHAFSCSGTPADCVRVGSISVMTYKPDVVLSGINFGYNTASDIQYSATVGAAFEAEFQGYRAIAFSEGIGVHDVTDRYLDEILAELIDSDAGEGRIFNVNFPQCTLEECGGVLRDRKVSRSMLYADGYKLLEKLPGGGMRYMVDGKYQEIAEDGTDLRAVLDGYVSVGVVNNIS